MAENDITVETHEEPVAKPVTEDGNIVEKDGVRYVREEALHAERTRAQRLAETVRALEPHLPAFNEYLKNAERTRTARDTAGRVSPDADDVLSDFTEDDLKDFAVQAGYYDDQNQPDLNRAKAAIRFQAKIADRRASRLVKPVQEGTVRDRARANREAVRAGRAFTDGAPIAEPQYLDAALRALPDELVADPEVASLSQVVAAGLEYLDKRRSGKIGTRREPLTREGSGGRVSRGGGGEVSDLDLAAARARGKSPEAWAKMAHTLEDTDILEEID